jgi:predicted metal-dependent hydrolase
MFYCSYRLQNIAVEETRLWTSCEYVHTVYDNGRETGKDSEDWVRSCGENTGIIAVYLLQVLI